MSETPEADGGKKKSSGKKKLIILIGGLALLGGGGAAAGFYAAGSMHKAEGPREDPNRPQLVLKGESPEDIAAKWLAKAKEEGGAGATMEVGKGKGLDLPKPGNPAAYQATYFQIPAPFTSNLSDSDAFVQVAIAVSTYYDNRVVQAVQTHETAIRSAVLMMMAQEQEVALSEPHGKEALQAKLLKTVNDTLKEKTGFGGVDNVYFTNFVIQ